MERRKRVVGLDYPLHSVSIPKSRPIVREQSREVKRSSVIGEDDIKSLFGYFCVILLCLALLLGQGVYINNQGLDIGSIKNSIDDYKLENDKSIIKIANLSSLENIEKLAVNEYNMIKVENVQYLLR